MRPSPGRSRGVAPLIIGVAAIIFGFLALAISLAAPNIANMLLGILGGEQGVYFFLIEIPTADANNPGTMTTPILNVFDLLRNVALVFFAVVLVIAGLYYALESFRLVSEGTAASIVTGSVFTALMIYLFLPVYNVAAGLINTLTSPDQEYILSPGMIQSLIEWAVRPPPSGNMADQTAAFFMSVFFLVMVAVTLISIGILGILRLFFIGAVAAMMPIILVLRLIPFTRRIAESFIDMLIGLMLSSLVAAIFLRFGYEVLNAGSFTGLAGSVVAWGTLIASAMMPTVLAPRLGSVFMTTAGMVTAAMSTATIGTIGTLSGIAVGTVRGGAAAAQAVKTGTLESWKAPFAALRSGVTTAAPFVTGALTGRFAGAIPTVGGIPSLGGTAAAAAESRQRLATHLDMFLKERAGTATEALMSALPFVKISPLASEADGLRWKEKIAEMSDEEAGKFFRESFPEDKLLERYNGKVGREFKSMIAKASPITVSSIIAHLKDMKEDEAHRRAFMKQALENRIRNMEKLKKQGYPIPEISKEADATPTFMRDIFRYGGETAKIVNAKFFHGALSHYDPKMPLQEARKAAKKFVEKVTIDQKKRRKLSDEEIAEKLADLVGIRNLLAEEKRAFGHAARQYLNTLQKDSPRILAAAWKAINDPKWTERVKSEDYTEAALRSVETGDLQGKLASIAFMDSREMLAKKASKATAEMKEREKQIMGALRTMFQEPVSLRHLFPDMEEGGDDGNGDGSGEGGSSKGGEVGGKGDSGGEIHPKEQKEEGKREEAGKGSGQRGEKRASLGGYTPPKPRKKGIVIAKGFGGAFTASLEKFMKEKKRGEEQ